MLPGTPCSHRYVTARRILMAQLSEVAKCSIFPTIDYVLGPRHECCFSKERGRPYLVGRKKKKNQTGKLWLGSTVTAVNLEGTRPVDLWSWLCGFFVYFHQRCNYDSRGAVVFNSLHSFSRRRNKTTMKICCCRL